MACLDTSALIDAAGRTGHPRRLLVRGLLAQLLATGQRLVTTRVCAAELWVGVERAQDRQRELNKVTALLSEFEVLELDDRSARLFGKNQAYLFDHGTPVGDMDVLIASIATANAEALVTRNPAHFERIPGLDVLSY